MDYINLPILIVGGGGGKAGTRRAQRQTPCSADARMGRQQSVYSWSDGDPYGMLDEPQYIE